MGWEETFVSQIMHLNHFLESFAWGKPTKVGLFQVTLSCTGLNLEEEKTVGLAQKGLPYHYHFTKAQLIFPDQFLYQN